MRTLLLLRHATAASGQGVPDAERPLTAAGREEAAAVGAALRGLDVAPTLVRCSTALRARETAEALGLAASRVDDASLYLAPPDDLLAAVRATPDDVPTLLLVAHNPGLQSLAHALARGDRDRDRLAAGYPPATLAGLALPVERWADVTAGQAALALLRHPG